jgi:hypothetical protein
LSFLIRLITLIDLNLLIYYPFFSQLSSSDVFFALFAHILSKRILYYNMSLGNEKNIHYHIW